jgi:putative transposase
MRQQETSSHYQGTEKQDHLDYTDVAFCVEAVEQAIRHGQPEIFNTDQGAQFTSLAFTERLKKGGIRISMDGRGRALDHVFVERLWRSVKYEEVYLRDYQSVWDAPEFGTIFWLL